MALLYIIFFVLLGSFAWGTFSLAPWVPTRKKDLKRILELANLKKRENFYDLGCGDGRVAVYISAHSEAEATGIEIALPLYIIAWLKQLYLRKKNLHFKLRSIYRISLKDADAVYLFAASPGHLKGKIIDKLENELSPGARVISYAFGIDRWTPLKVDKPSDRDLKIYLYEIN